MDTLDIRNLQLSYQAIYDDVLCESMEDLGIIGEARDGYGDDSKFNKPDDKIEKPGTTVPKPKKGGYGRISRSTPYGIGAHANRTASRVTTIVGEDPGAPRAEKMAKETKKKGPKMVKKDGKWVKENIEFQLWIDELLDEGYDLSDYTIDEMVEIYENTTEKLKKAAGKKSRKSSGLSPEKREIYARLASHAKRRTTPATRRTGRPFLNQEIRDQQRNLAVELNRFRDRPGTHTPGPGSITKNPKKLRKQKAIGELPEALDYYDMILEYLLDEGYAETVENAEAIMVNMSEEWVGDIVEEFLDEERESLPIAKMKKKEEQLKNELQKRRRGRIKTGIRLDSIEGIRKTISKRGGKEDLSTVFNP